MPYVSALAYKMVRPYLTPTVPENGTLSDMEQSIAALNRRIKSVPGTGPTDEWQRLMYQHSLLLKAYRDAGGRL